MAVRRLAEKQPDAFAFSNDNEAWAKGQIGKFPDGRRQSAVIPLLWRAQEQHDGWLPEPAIRYVADMLGMPYIRALEVATFYTMFNLAPVGRHFVQLCGTTPCMLRGSDELREVCKRVIGPESTVSDDGALSWLEVECLGACVNAPMVQINKDYYEDLTPDGFEALLGKLRAGEDVSPGPQSERTTSYPLGGPTTLTDDAAIHRTPPRETGRVDPAEEPVAKAQPEPADERLEDQTGAIRSEIADEVKAKADGTQAAVAKSSTVAEGIPQGEDRSGDAAARKKSSIESSTFAKSENAPMGGGAPGATTGDAQAERKADARRPDPNENARIGQETGTAAPGEADGTEPAAPPIPSNEAGSAVAPQVRSDKPESGGRDVQASPVGVFDRGADPAGAKSAAVAGAKEPETPEEAAAVRAAARSDDRAPVVLDAPDGEPDDLKRISGVGPKLEGTLNKLGFHHFAQIAVWTEENIDWVDSHLRFKGRIRRDDWVTQAKTLAGGGETEFAQRYKKGETGQKPEWLRDEKDKG